MKVVASLIVRNELGRYLEPCVAHLREFCDEVRVLDDASTDGSFEWLASEPRVEVLQAPASRFFAHEGHARQALLLWTLQAKPTHVLAIDADEFVSDGPGLRRLLEAEPVYARRQAWSLEMCEVWEADESGVCVRMDGGWVPHPVAVVWRPAARVDRSWRIRDRALACGRVPVPVASAAAARTGISLLHLGWANEAERAARHHRYVEADGGRFHARRHLDSIMDGCNRVALEGRAWPDGLAGYRERIVERATLVAA